MKKGLKTMKVKIIKRTPDYREACQLFSEFSKKGTTYSTYDFTTKEYTVELVQDAHTDSEIHRLTLLNMYYNTDSIEELLAITYADSAIKTLVDMGVLE